MSSFLSTWLFLSTQGRTEEKEGEKEVVLSTGGETPFILLYIGETNLHVIAHVLSCQSHCTTKSQNRKVTDFDGLKSVNKNRIHDKV